MKKVICKKYYLLILVFSLMTGIINPEITQVFAVTNNLSNPFDSCECVNLAFEAAPNNIKQLIKWTRGTSFDYYPKPLSWISWYAGNWGANITNYGPQMDATLDWANSINNTPALGAIVEYPRGSTTTSTKVVNGKTTKQSYTFKNNAHVAVVTAYNPSTNTISTSDKNWGECGPVTRDKVDVTSSMIFIHDPAPLQKSIVESNTKFSTQTIESEFYSKIPPRNIWVKSASQFELWIDGKLVMNAERPHAWKTFSKQGVSVTPFRIHSVNLKWWNACGDPEPQFDQTWWPNTFVGAAEPDPDTALPVNYTYILNPNPVTQGNKASVTASASANSPYTVTSIDIFAGFTKVGTISGSNGSVTFLVQDFSPGNIQIRLIANVPNWQGSISEAQTKLTIQPGENPVSGIPNYQSNCSITSFNILPSSPQQKGTIIHITGSGSCGENSVRAIRLLVDGNSISEIGAPNLDTNWNTADFSTGIHTLELQVAKVGDNDWTNVGSQTKSLELTNSITPTTPSSQKASCSITSFNVSPSSPQNVGASIHITGQAQCSTVEVRAIRLLVDGNSIYEIGAPNLDAYWKTGDFSSGSHTIELQVAGKGDNAWANIGSQTKFFELTNAPIVSTATPNRTPSCSISSYSISPSSPHSVGTPVHITASGTCGGIAVRAMRILIDGSSIYEIGAPTIETNWNTNSFSEGNHQIDIQVAAVGDNNWSFSGNQTATYNLTAAPVPTIAPTPYACQSPTLSSPTNGQLLNSSSVSLSWNLLSGASSYKMEIWGGDFGGNHQAPCGWSSSTSCTVNNLGKYNYMWRVLANTNGQECASQEWNFTISY